MARKITFHFSDTDLLSIEKLSNTLKLKDKHGGRAKAVKFAIYYTLHHFDFLTDYKDKIQFKKNFPKNKIDNKIRSKVFRRYNFTCALCKHKNGIGKKDIPLHIDHIIPIAYGGSSNIENLQVLCATCNLRKGKRID